MRYVKGDLLKMVNEGHFDVIVHGCNCFHTMGGGIARAIAIKYPASKAIDETTRYGDIGKLGTYTKTYPLNKLERSFVLVNAYTQYAPSRNADVFEYEAFELILKKLADEYPYARYGFPLIGCGLAGGNRDRIMKLIEDHLASRIDGTVTIVEWDKE